MAVVGILGVPTTSWITWKLYSFEFRFRCIDVFEKVIWYTIFTRKRGYSHFQKTWHFLGMPEYRYKIKVN